LLGTGVFASALGDDENGGKSSRDSEAIFQASEDFLGVKCGHIGDSESPSKEEVKRTGPGSLSSDHKLEALAADRS